MKWDLIRSSVLAVLWISFFIGGCTEVLESEQPTTAQVIVLAAFDPDFANPREPTPGRLLWISTRAGTARFLLEGREVTDDRVPVTGGELVTTDIEPSMLEPDNNVVEIYFVLEQHGGTTISATADLFVTARCTRHDDCPGSCVEFECVP